MNLKVLGAISALIIIGGLITISQSSNFTLSSADSIQPCEQPLTYRFGDIDSRFNITEKELAGIMKKVEELWATALDKDLLDYQKEGKVAIHLVYGEDQKRTEAERIFAKRIEMKQREIENKQREYDLAVKRYQRKKEDFQSTVNEYNRTVESYNDYAKEWSGKKNTTDAEKRFKQMEREINRLKSLMDRKQQDLEVQRQQTSKKSRQLNQLVEEQNRMAAKYNSQFSKPKKFDQGRYIKQGTSEKINIFQFANDAQLKTVLAHEVGHAFGLGHVENPKSIMHEMMEKQNIFNLQLTKEDIAALKNRCSN